MSYLYFFCCFLLSPLPSAFFSSSETALANTTKVDGAVSELKEDEQATLLTILFGNHWSNQLPTMVLSAWSVSLFGGWFWVPMGIHTFYTLALGEMLPKAYALIHANKYASLLSPFLLPLVKVVGPFLSRFAPKREKTKAELCLEERLEAEKEAEIKTLTEVGAALGFVQHGPKETGWHRVIKMREDTPISVAYRAMLSPILKKRKKDFYKYMAQVWVEVYSDDKEGGARKLGYLSLAHLQAVAGNHLGGGEGEGK